MVKEAQQSDELKIVMWICVNGSRSRRPAVIASEHGTVSSLYDVITFTRSNLFHRIVQLDTRLIVFTSSTRNQNHGSALHDFADYLLT